VTYSVHHREINRDKSRLVLPGGKRADAMRVGELHRELSRLSVPGITASMGKDDLLNAYEAALTARAEAMRRSGDAEKSSENISPAEMRLAAEAMQEATR
jgi:hypothetical protein